MAANLHAPLNADLPTQRRTWAKGLHNQSLMSIAHNFVGFLSSSSLAGGVGRFLLTSTTASESSRGSHPSRTSATRLRQAASYT